jgi:hypothetical protein
VPATRPSASARSSTDGAVAAPAREVARVARRARTPALAAVAGAAGLAGGLAIGARLGRRRSRAHVLADGIRRAVATVEKASGTADDVRLLREQLESLNRRSPVEVLLDGLTHRRGAHRSET